jgi:hypothetical protein
MTRKDFVHLLLPLSLTVLYQQVATAGSMDTHIKRGERRNGRGGCMGKMDPEAS